MKRGSFVKKRVLVVDDSRVALMEIERLLKDTEFEIVGYCPDGESALNQYEEVQPDLVLMDIVMPGQSGLEVSAVLRQLYPDSRIIIVSSLNDDVIEDFTRAIGCKGLCQKPFGQEELLDTMRKALI